MRKCRNINKGTDVVEAEDCHHDPCISRGEMAGKENGISFKKNNLFSEIKQGLWSGKRGEKKKEKKTSILSTQFSDF